MKQSLSQEQKEIAFFNDCEGAILVEASAGSGKTRILTERVRYLLNEKADKFFSVLCLTFTNKAADEMQERLTGVAKLSQRAFIGNFHEFCLNQILRKQRHQIGLQEMPHIFDENDKKKIIEEVIYMNDELKRIYEFSNISDPKKRAKQQRDVISKCINFISDAKRKLTIVPEHVSNYENWGEKNTFLYKNYNFSLENQNAIDYDDILLYAYRILTERPPIAKMFRRLYQYILVDEAQDLNYAQYQILRTFCGEDHKNLMMVGDPKQAIYAFNGASPDFMQQEFVNDFDAKKMVISHNYRSSTRVLELAHHIRPNGAMPNNYFTGIRQIQSFKDEKEEAKWVIENIKNWIKQRTYQENDKDIKIPINLDNIAVLSRNRYVFKELITQLERDEQLKGNYYLRKGSEQYQPESTIIKIFDWGLRIIVNPMDVLHFNQIYQLLNIPFPNKGLSRTDALFAIDLTPNISEKIKNQLSIIVESWKKIHSKFHRFDLILSQLRDKIEKLDMPNEEKLTIDFDLHELENLWKGFIMNTSSNSQNLANFRYFLAMRSIDQNKKGLTLATIHTVKGLEFEIVFLLGVNNGVLPDYRANTKKQLSEERNNAYVAVTRAKKCVYVTYPLNRMMPWKEAKSQQISTFFQNF